MKTMYDRFRARYLTAIENLSKINQDEAYGYCLLRYSAGNGVSC